MIFLPGNKPKFSPHGEKHLLQVLDPFRTLQVFPPYFTFFKTSRQFFKKKHKGFHLFAKAVYHTFYGFYLQGDTDLSFSFLYLFNSHHIEKEYLFSIPPDCPHSNHTRQSFPAPFHECNFMWIIVPITSGNFTGKLSQKGPGIRINQICHIHLKQVLFFIT